VRSAAVECVLRVYLCGAGACGIGKRNGSAFPIHRARHGTRRAPPMSRLEPASIAISLFFSYAHKDERYRNKLETHLSTLRRQGLISGWHDRRITGGTEWKGEIEKQLDAAQVILLLISADFIHSDFCTSTELRRAVERHNSGVARVVPIIVRPCDWHSAEFGRLQALPKDGKAITDWRPQDKAYLDIAQGIRRVAEELSAKTNRSDGQVHPSKVAGRDERPQFEEKLKVSLSACMKGSSLPPFGTGEPLHLEIDLTVVNIGRDPVFVVAASLQDRSGRTSLGFSDVCSETEPLQPGGRRKGRYKLLHHKPFPEKPWQPCTDEKLYEQNLFEYRVLRFICQADSAFRIETALGTQLTYPAVEVCDQFFLGWPILATPKDILNKLGSKTLKDFEDEERSGFEAAGARVVAHPNDSNSLPLSIEVLSLSYDEVVNRPSDSIVIVTPYPRRYLAEIAVTNCSEHPVSIRSIVLRVAQRAYQRACQEEEIRILPRDYKKIDLTFPVEHDSALASGAFELEVLPALGGPAKVHGGFPFETR
jgi:TIR domain